MPGRDVTIGEVAAYELGVETGRAELQQRVADLEAALREIVRHLAEEPSSPKSVTTIARAALKETVEP